MKKIVINKTQFYKVLGSTNGQNKTELKKKIINWIWLGEMGKKA